MTLANAIKAALDGGWVMQERGHPTVEGAMSVIRLNQEYQECYLWRTEDIIDEYNHDVQNG